MSSSLPACDAVAIDPHEYNLSGKQRTVLSGSLLLSFTGMFSAYAGLAAVLLPAQVAAVDPDSKEASLALILSTSAFITLFVQPIIGAISDRTRSRWGRRSPWMALGAVGGALFLLVIGHLTTIALLMAAWVAIQVLLNILQGPLTAILPDRIPPEKRGVVSAFIGIGSQVGATVGIIVAAQFTRDSAFSLGYTIFAIVVLIVVLAMLLLNRDADNRAVPVAPFGWRSFLRGFWVSPKTAPDFWWAFMARVVLVLGYWGVTAYGRYALEDYFKVGDQVDQAQSLSSVVQLITVLVASAGCGWLSDRLGRRKIFVGGASFVMAFGLIIPLLMPTLTGFYLFTAVLGLGYGAYMSLDMALMTQVLPSAKDAAKDLGLLNVATNVPQSLGPTLAGVIVTSFAAGADKVPGYRVLFGAGAVLVALAAIMIKPIRSVR